MASSDDLTIHRHRTPRHRNRPRILRATRNDLRHHPQRVISIPRCPEQRRETRTPPIRRSRLLSDPRPQRVSARAAQRPENNEKRIRPRNEPARIPNPTPSVPRIHRTDRPRLHPHHPRSRTRREHHRLPQNTRSARPPRAHREAHPRSRIHPTIHPQLKRIPSAQFRTRKHQTTTRSTPRHDGTTHERDECRIPKRLRDERCRIRTHPPQPTWTRSDRTPQNRESNESTRPRTPTHNTAAITIKTASEDRRPRPRGVAWISSGPPEAGTRVRIPAGTHQLTE